jgi:hypothetical protein
MWTIQSVSVRHQVRKASYRFQHSEAINIPPINPYPHVTTCGPLTRSRTSPRADSFLESRHFQNHRQSLAQPEHARHHVRSAFWIREPSKSRSTYQPHIDSKNLATIFKSPVAVHHLRPTSRSRARPNCYTQASVSSSPSLSPFNKRERPRVGELFGNEKSL